MDGMEKYKMAQLFRKSSIERLSSPEQLDKSIVVTSPMSWTVLIGIALIIVCFVIWAICGTMPTTLEARGIVSNGIYTNSIYSDLSGTITEVLVKEGQTAEVGTTLLRIEDANKHIHEVIADARYKITKVCVNAGESVNYTEELFGISPVSNGDAFVVFYVGVEQIPSISMGMEVVVNMPAFDNQKYGHMKGNIVAVDSYASSTESIRRILGTNEDVIEYLGMTGQPMVAVTCKLEKDDNSANGFFWSNDKGEEVSVNYGNIVDIKIIMDEQAPITKLIPGLE